MKEDKSNKVNWDREKNGNKPRNDKSNADSMKKSQQEAQTVNFSLVPYWFLVAVRVVLTLLPQIGYVHPDEFFQSVEVVTGELYSY